MGPVRDTEDRLCLLEREVIEIKAKMGTVTLNPPTLALLWAVMLAAITSVMFVVRLDSKVEQLAVVVTDATSTIREHESLPGHSVTVERIEELGRRLDAIKDTRPKPSPREASE